MWRGVPQGHAGYQADSGSPGHIQVGVLVWLCALAATEPLPSQAPAGFSWFASKFFPGSGGGAGEEGECVGLQPGQLSLMWAQPSLWSLGWVSPCGQ